MTPLATQCRAAAKSGTADMMEKESQTLGNNCLTRDSKRTRMKQTMLAHSSVEARNVAAGTALELYYRLAELEAKSDLLRDGLAIARDALAELRKLKAQGLKVPPDFAQSQKQQLEFAADLTRAQLGIQQINGELGRLLDWHELGVFGFLWPHDNFDVTQAPDDPEAAVALGMAHRAQLTLIRAVRDDIDARTLPTMLLLLRSYNGFLGMSRSESFISFMTGSISVGKHQEVDQRRRQMDDMLREQEYVVAQEIRQAIHTIAAKTRLVALAKEKIKIAQDKLKDLQDKQASGIATPLEVSAQRLVLGQAQGELIQEVMAWHTARAKLKQAQGMLAVECGYTPEDPWPAVRGPAKFNPCLPGAVAAEIQ
jgi:outer membrane protein TolC